MASSKLEMEIVNILGENKFNKDYVFQMRDRNTMTRLIEAQNLRDFIRQLHEKFGGSSWPRKQKVAKN